MLSYLKRYWFYCLLAPLFMLGEIAMDLLQPAFMATIVDKGVLAGDLELVLKLGGRMILLVLLGGTSGVLCGIFANLAAQNFGNDVRKDLFAQIMTFSFEQTDRFTTGSLVTRITNDVTQAQNMVMMSIRALVRTSIMFVGGIYMLYRQSPRFAFVVALGMPFVVLVVFFFLHKVAPIFSIIQARLDKINCVMQENIAGARVVKAYVKEAHALAEFSKANDELCAANLHVQTMLAFMHPMMNIILNICVAAVLYVGGMTVKNTGGITPGEIMAAITYISMILMRIIFMANIFRTFTRASASWKRIKEVLETEPAQRPGDERPEDDRRGEVEFRNVSFAYPETPDSPVLKEISFKVRQGETVALIGATGSGKSSLIHLIPRFYDAAEGEVLVNGRDVRSYDPRHLRERIGIVQQEAELFSRSIADNVRWGREQASDDEVRHAAEIAQARRFIESKEEGYDTQVTEGGHSLSGGQKQRLSIARAVIKQPEIMIFDDAVSALDLRTEAKLNEALDQELSGTTRIIVAQRIASVKQADRILVLEDGRICASGTHEELLQSSEVYREICRSQMKKGVPA